MAHYAKIVDSIVETVIVAEPDYIVTLEGTWVKASYNMYGGVYLNNETNTPAEDQSVINGDEARERKNFPMPGYTYDGTGFIAPKPYASWLLNSTSYLWEAPTPIPEGGNLRGDRKYGWNENSESWVTYPDDGKNYGWSTDTEEWVEGVAGSHSSADGDD